MSAYTIFCFAEQFGMRWGFLRINSYMYSSVPEIESQPYMVKLLFGFIVLGSTVNRTRHSDLCLQPWWVESKV